MPIDSSKPSSIQSFVELMRASQVPDAAIASFNLHYQRLHEGERGMLPEKAIKSILSLPKSDDFEEFTEPGRSAMSRMVMIKLNGGLGTSMGLSRAKTLLLVRDNLSFLDLIARQVLALRAEMRSEIPLVLMNSFRTALDSDQALAAYPGLALDDLPLSFLQNRVPKVLQDSLSPALDEANPELMWCPPGHGDLFTALKGSGLLDRLLEKGIEYGFVCNADNLGAVPDPHLLGYMVTQELDFLLEAADRTAADRKGGHLCLLHDGRLALRESAQCPPEEAESFQDIGRHQYFNTNNLWVHLPTLGRLLEEHDGFLPLPTVVNHKTLDPRDPKSPKVFQLETVMGTAISLFPNAAAVRVPRYRFSPVKNTNDLLGVRSDAFDLGADGRISLSPRRNSPPVIRLDNRYFKMIDGFEERFPNGPPSLIACDRLTVDGDLTFGANNVVEGETVVSTKDTARVPDGAVLSGHIEL